MKTAYIYSRVSTTQQQLSPEWQAAICKNYYDASLAQRGYAFGGIFHDHGESAFSVAWKDRTAGRELFNVIKPGDIIVVAKLCRAFRNLRDRENTMHFLTQVGIDLCILDVGMDTTTAAGKFAAGIIALQCQWESDVKSERQKAAHVIRRQRKTPGRRHPPPGWKWDKLAAELVPDLRERKLLELIYQWRASRVRSIKDTCRWLTEEGIRRDSGATYNVQWVQRAWMSRQKGWPQEGYVQSFWRNPEISVTQKDKYRLPKVGGKQHVNFHPRRVRRANEADLHWISQAYGRERVAFSPQSAN